MKLAYKVCFVYCVPFIDGPHTVRSYGIILDWRLPWQRSAGFTQNPGTEYSTTFILICSFRSNSTVLWHGQITDDRRTSQERSLDSAESFHCMYIHTRSQILCSLTFVTAGTFPPGDHAEFLEWLHGTPQDVLDESRLVDHYRSFLFGLMQTMTECVEDICGQCTHSFLNHPRSLCRLCDMKVDPSRCLQ